MTPFSGIVIHGLKRGKEFGFPTANILLDQTDATIEPGVYATELTLDNEKHQGMLYVGTRPTLNLSKRSVEIHIFNFNRSIYGIQIQFYVLKKIRGDQRFNSIEELIAQIENDQAAIKAFFETNS
ncbi:MAG TPA: riboflavin kinase [Bacteroidales bacterium]|nr:riboflavin kinase [Bacteroidales bacterium]HOH22573.1 riboflavin kinase [Bacteroidales bacterium]HPZ02800.1 riboflavin kinase [Bacteroidales bacterium]HQB74317.1 riboflavin kinase [Bacteroidales bacterium]HQQ20552.1 riboflavin kinase [Bacteroidales bacterium]